MAPRAGGGVRSRRGKLGEGAADDLTAYAKSEFALAKRLDDGSTARQHAEAFERQTGKRPPELDGPDLPPDLDHVWHWFLELHARRTSNGFGSNPLSWTDLFAWVTLTQPGVRLEEIRVILALDNAWMASQAEEAVKKDQAQKAKATGKVPPGRR